MKISQHFKLSLFAITLLCLLLPAPSFANSKYAAFVMDADTGLILHERYANKILHPASLTKMMTMLMAFEAIDAKKMSMNTRVRMTRHAAGMIPSKLNIPVGQTIRVKDALYALATKSANDVAVALGEHIAGSETRFAQRMTRRARSIGMSKTTFRNASGLHDKRQVSTARDMAKLARYILIRYPHYYHIFNTKSFTYKGHTYKNHNKLLGNYKGADGFKTGYINASGFNLVASAKRDGGRIIGVVFGGKTGKSRNAHMVELLDRGFGRLDKVRIAAARNIPKPQNKPDMQAVLMASANGASYTSISSISSTQNKQRRAQVSSASNKVMDIGAFSEHIGQGDYDPAVSKRFETGLLAIAVHKGEYKPNANTKTQAPAIRYSNDLGTTTNVAYAPSTRGNWAIQIGAYSSQKHSDYALRKALTHLPNELSTTQPAVVPLRTASGVLYRARLKGYTKQDAIRACAYFKDCISIAP